MLRRRNTKIIATLGPSSSSKEVIEQLFLKGVDVFRLNFSHGTHDVHHQNYTFIREIEAKYDVPIAVLMDLQGPKLRIGTFKQGAVFLEEGQLFRFTLACMEGTKDQVTLPHPEIFRALVPQTVILVDDGKLRFEVLESRSQEALTKVLVGGRLSDRKGVNLPGVSLPIQAITEKDKKDLHFGLALGVDFVGLSFVQSREDLEQAQSLIQGRAAIAAKIEKPLALKNLEEILPLADAVMVARGDLGVELMPEEVPLAQTRILQACRSAGKPVLVATQMLESMIQAPTPTRAEVSDVAHAVYEGADGVMLSAESASGQYPLESVTMMNRVVEAVEKDPSYPPRLYATHLKPESTVSDAITTSAVQSVQTVGAKAICCFTSTGKTSARVSRWRPLVPIVGVTPHEKVARRQVLTWGVFPRVVQNITTYAEMVQALPTIVRDMPCVEPGDFVVLTAGEPLGIVGGTNILRIMKIT